MLEVDDKQNDQDYVNQLKFAIRASRKRLYVIKKRVGALQRARAEKNVDSVNIIGKELDNALSQLAELHHQHLLADDSSGEVEIEVEVEDKSKGEGEDKDKETDLGE